MRVGIIGIAITSKEHIPRVNRYIGENSDIVLARLGLPIEGQELRLITLVVHADTDTIGRLAGEVGSLPGVKIKSMLM